MDLFGALKGVIESLGYGRDVNAFLIVFGLALARISSAISLTPFLGGRAVSGNAKIGLSILLTLLVVPGLKVGTPEGHISPLLFFALLLKEAMIGLTIGIFSQFIFNAVQMAGALVDTARGMDQPGLFAPQLGSNASTVAQLKLQMALVVFLAVNGHLLFIRSLALSFEQIPMRGFAHFENPGGADRAVALSAQILAISLQLAAPVIIVLFLVDVCFAVIAKVAPQMNVNMESQPVKSMVGLVVLFLAIGIIATRFQNLVSSFLWDVFTFVATLA
jgi:flagellar biosynthetic protein FliR